MQSERTYSGRRPSYGRVCKPVALAAGQEYSQATQRSLQNIDESLINYELLEALVCHIVSSQQAINSDANAILIFMPGAPEISRLVRALQA